MPRLYRLLRLLPVFDGMKEQRKSALLAVNSRGEMEGVVNNTSMRLERSDEDRYALCSFSEELFLMNI